jgi:hypothetical protein
LYGCETWSLALREEHRLRVFENRVLRRIFGPKRNEYRPLVGKRGETTGRTRRMWEDNIKIYLIDWIG